MDAIRLVALDDVELVGQLEGANSGSLALPLLARGGYAGLWVEGDSKMPCTAHEH